MRRLWAKVHKGVVHILVRNLDGSYTRAEVCPETVAVHENVGNHYVRVHEATCLAFKSAGSYPSPPAAASDAADWLIGTSQPDGPKFFGMKRS